MHGLDHGGAGKRRYAAQHKADAGENRVPTGSALSEASGPRQGETFFFGHSCKKNRLGGFLRVLGGLDEEVDLRPERRMGIDSPAAFH